MDDGDRKTAATVASVTAARIDDQQNNTATGKATSPPSSSGDRVERFLKLFSGYEKAYGTYANVKGVAPGEKATGKPLTHRGAIPRAVVEGHLAGTGPGLGVVPLRKDDECWFGAIDIDIKGKVVLREELPTLEKRIEALKLPLIVCRSKSGGAHCYIFFKQPTPAIFVINALEHWASILGYGGCEIFPKQSSRANEDDIGNWINLPYFKADATTRYALRGGVSIPAEEFFDFAESRRVNVDDISSLDKLGVSSDDTFADGPPCLQTLHACDGFPDGTRNDGLFNVAVYFKGKNPDGWQDDVAQYNADNMDPPLTSVEVNSIIKSVAKKDYGYGCTKPPINAHCNRRECLRRDHGIGGNSDPAQRIVRRFELWRAEDNEGYVTVSRRDHQEHFRIKSEAFKELLAYEYLQRTQKSLRATALNEAVLTASAVAKNEGGQHRAWLRVAAHEGKLYLDLGDRDWTVVEIDRDGWRPTNSAPVKFRRTGGMGELPRPVHGGTIDDFRPFVNVAGDRDFKLLTGFMVAGLRPDRPLPILNIAGEHGSAKTTMLKAIKMLLDPAVAAGRGLPDNEDDLVVAANNNWLVTADNVSFLAPEMADALCRLSTGGGISKRALYTDGDEYAIEALRPIALTGINQVTERQDFISRSVIITLRRISDEEYRDEEAYWQRFQEARPRILGALLDGAVTALRRLPQVRGVSRMADFAKWCEAAGPAFGWSDGEFLDTYAEMRSNALQHAAQSDPFASVVFDWLSSGARQFAGPATALLQALEAFVKATGREKVMALRAWPPSANVVPDRLRRSAPGLRALGVEYEPGHDTKRNVSVYRLALTSAVADDDIPF